MPKFTVMDRGGKRQEVEISLQDYKAASEKSISLTEHLASKYPAVDTTYGSVFEQAMLSAGMFVQSDHRNGVRSPRMKDVFDGRVDIDTATVRGDGDNRHDPAGRILFPEIILQTIEAELTDDHGDFIAGFNNMIAQTQTVNSPRYDQPVIDVSGPRDSASQPAAQLSEPARMVSITLNNRTYRIPSASIGLEISDEALQSTTLDLVNLAMTSQARGEQIRMIENQLGAIVSGDSDIGETALSGDLITAYDSSISTAGKMTQKAWVKFLRNDYRKRTITNLLMDLDTALAIQNREGKPNVQTDDPNSPRIDTQFTVDNLGLPSPRVLILDDGIIPANTIVGLDNRFAMRRVVNTSASYSATEQFVMRRASAYRVDYGQATYKLMTDAFSMVTLATS